MKPSRLSNRVSEDTGAATVLAAVLIAALTTIAVAGIWLAAVVIARHRAQAAADLAAVAAAARLPTGSAAACSQAEEVAGVMGSEMQSCTVSGLDVVVVTAVRADRYGRWRASASARAGPVTPG